MRAMQKMKKPEIVLSPEEKKDLDFILEAIRYYRAHLKKEGKQVNS
jgi:hypothetical protein